MKKAALLVMAAALALAAGAEAAAGQRTPLLQEGKKVAAICAAPALVLTAAGVTAGRKVTCYPGMEKYFKDADFSEDRVVTDGNLITSRGPATAMEFAFTLADELVGNSQPVKDGMLYIR